MAIEGKVARVLTEFDVALTGGSDDGVEDGQIAIVFREFEVSDPDTLSLLGNARLTLVRLKVFQVHERFCVARTYESIQKPGLAVALLNAERERIKVTTKSEPGPAWVTIAEGDSVQFVPANSRT